MKSFVASIVAIVVIGLGAWSVLENRFQSTAESAFTTSSVRIDSGKH